MTGFQPQWSYLLAGDKNHSPGLKPASSLRADAALKRRSSTFAPAFVWLIGSCRVHTLSCYSWRSRCHAAILYNAR